ncbi:MAG: N-acetyltransferase [Caulobacteraceae bacterium]|nr:N-acetyltransferase [Caulobacteraceae bacterium]
MPIAVITAGKDHLDWLLTRDRHISPGWVLRCLAAGEYLVAIEGAAPVGFLRYSWFWRAIPYMELIRVDEVHRRSGVGSALVAAWEAAMREQGASLLMTSSMADEPEPRAWHRRNGFVDSGALTFGALQATPEVFFVKAIEPRAIRRPTPPGSRTPRP